MVADFLYACVPELPVNLYVRRLHMSLQNIYHSKEIYKVNLTFGKVIVV
jgi:hypothetical protein